MDQLIFDSLSHTHYWYGAGMLKAPAYYITININLGLVPSGIRILYGYNGIQTDENFSLNFVVLPLYVLCGHTDWVTLE